jgi:hypothetical protein
MFLNGCTCSLKVFVLLLVGFLVCSPVENVEWKAKKSKTIQVGGVV